MNAVAGFTMEEYLTIFNAFIFGNVTSIFFNNWASWIQNRARIVFDVRHVVFTILVFLLTVDYWWVTYSRIHLIVSSESLFFLSLLDPLTFFVLTIDLFPKLEKNLTNLPELFARKERMIYLLFGLNFLIGIMISVSLGETNVLHEENLFRLAAAGLCLIAILLHRSWLYDVLLLAGIILLIAHIVFEGNPPAPGLSGGFSFAEYLTVYLSFFYGFVAYLFLKGWSTLAQQIKQIQFGKEYFLWTLLGFALLIDAWWGDWNKEPTLTNHLGYFLVSLAIPIVFYLLATVMFPVTDNLEEVDMRDFFRKNEKVIYILFAFVFSANFIISITLEHQDLYANENFFRAGAVLLLMIAYLSQSVRVRRAVLGIGWVLFTAHIFIDGLR